MRFAIITSLFLARCCSRSSNSGEARFSSQPAPRNFGIPREKASGVDPQSRVKTHVPVLGDTCSDGTTHVAPQFPFFPPLYVFLTSFDFCELEIAPPSSRNRKRIDSGARWMRSNIGNGRHDLFENLEYFANFLRPKNLWYRIVLDLITRPPVFSRIRYG